MMSEIDDFYENRSMPKKKRQNDHQSDVMSVIDNFEKMNNTSIRQKEIMFCHGENGGS